MSAWRLVAHVVAKDVRAELRTKEALTSTVFFSLLVLLVFNFAFEPGARDVTVVGAGILWTAFLFAAILAMNRLMLNEREDGGLDGLMLCPLDRASLYVAKCLTLLLVLGLAQIFTVGLFMLFFNVPVDARVGPLALVVLLGTVGLVALGTTFATMSVRTRTREVMLPLLLVPIAVPLLIAVVEVTGGVLAGETLADSSRWLRLLVAFDVLFLALGYLTFPAIIEE